MDGDRFFFWSGTNPRELHESPAHYRTESALMDPGSVKTTVIAYFLYWDNFCMEMDIINLWCIPVVLKLSMNWRTIIEMLSPSSTWKCWTNLTKTSYFDFRNLLSRMVVTFKASLAKTCEKFWMYRKKKLIEIIFSKLFVSSLKIDRLIPFLFPYSA